MLSVIASMFGSREKVRYTYRSARAVMQDPETRNLHDPTTDIHGCTADLKQQWRELFGAEPPAFSRSFLQSRLGHRVQELAFGGLKAETVSRLEALGERLDGGNVVLRRIRADDRPIAGTRLVREYRGIEHVVTVLNDGYDYEGRPYRSLSAIARSITETRWNGWVFFGLKAAGGRG
jgi:hypothetical protein